jgi:hypothetical protein
VREKSIGVFQMLTSGTVVQLLPCHHAIEGSSFKSCQWQQVKENGKKVWKLLLSCHSNEPPIREDGQST